jgi:hypothetical protein
MGNSTGTDMLDDYLHLGVVGETAILLFKPEMSRVKVYDEGWRAFRVFPQDIGSCFNCRSCNR